MTTHRDDYALVIGVSEYPTAQVVIPDASRKARDFVGRS
jgi:hypothetical protein